MYAILGTWLDLAYAVSTLCRFLSNPTNAHHGAAKRVLRYLRPTQNYGLGYEGMLPKASAYSDSDWANDRDTRRSVSGFLFSLNGAAVSWKSRRQSAVALSSTEAEYIAYAEAAKEAIWLQRLLIEIDTRKSLRNGNTSDGQWGCQPVTILVDNQGAQKLVNNPKHYDRTKHIDIRHHFIHDAKERGEIDIDHVPSADQTADILTKPLGRLLFERHHEAIDIVAIGNTWSSTLPVLP